LKKQRSLRGELPMAHVKSWVLIILPHKNTKSFWQIWKGNAESLSCEGRFGKIGYIKRGENCFSGNGVWAGRRVRVDNAQCKGKKTPNAERPTPNIEWTETTHNAQRPTLNVQWKRKQPRNVERRTQNGAKTNVQRSTSSADTPVRHYADTRIPRLLFWRDLNFDNIFLVGIY